MSDTGFLRRERSKVVEIAPMIGSVALFLKHEHEPDYEAPAATDGERVICSDDYFEMSFPERNGVLLHEYLHVALSHPQRASVVAMKEKEEYDQELMNIAMDAIINYGIVKQYSASAYIKLPAGIIRWEDITGSVEKYTKTITVAFTGRPIPQNWLPPEIPPFGQITCEVLYRILKQVKDCANACMQGSKPGNPAGEGQDPGDSGEGEGEEQGVGSNDNEPLGNAVTAKAAQDLLDKLRTMDDVQIGEGKSLGQLRKEIAQNSAKLENSMRMHGTQAAGLIEALRGDIPPPQVPWETEFRAKTQRYLTRERIKHPARPSRHVLTQTALGTQNLLWSPGRRRKPAPRAALIIDSSGSVSMDIYAKYLAEVQGLIQRTNVEITVIVADADIQLIQEIKSVRDIPKIEFKGRGGTDFRPALAWVDERQYDLAIYLTDLCGSFPDKTRTPTLWVGPENPRGANQQAPIGRTIWIEQ